MTHHYDVISVSGDDDVEQNAKAFCNTNLRSKKPMGGGGQMAPPDP